MSFVLGSKWIRMLYLPWLTSILLNHGQTDDAWKKTELHQFHVCQSVPLPEHTWRMYDLELLLNWQTELD